MNSKNIGTAIVNVLFAVLICAIISAIFSSCSGSSSAVSASSSSTKLMIINASPDVGPLLAYVNNTQIGINSAQVTSTSSQTYFRYSSTPIYYGIGSGTSLLQLRNATGLNLINVDTNATNGANYTLYCTGLYTIDSLVSILTVDTATISTIGRGKVRFVNASPRTPALTLTANGVTAFPGIAYTKVSAYIEFPAGVYDFKLSATSAPGTTLVDLPSITIQDGRLYTLYTKGLVGRTDTAAISLNLITNK